MAQAQAKARNPSPSQVLYICNVFVVGTCLRFYSCASEQTHYQLLASARERNLCHVIISNCGRAVAVSLTNPIALNLAHSYVVWEKQICIRALLNINPSKKFCNLTLTLNIFLVAF